MSPLKSNQLPRAESDMSQHFESISRLVRPDLVRQFPHKLQLVLHILPYNCVSFLVTCKSTLWADAQSLQRLLPRLPGSLSYNICGLEHPLLHLLFVLQLRELTCDDTKNDVLIGWEMQQRLEVTGPRGVVLEVVGLHIKVLEDLGGDAVVAAFGEVTGAHEVTAADVETEVHLRGVFRDAGVVSVDVDVKEIIERAVVGGVLLPSFDHLLGAEVWSSLVSADTSSMLRQS